MHFLLFLMGLRRGVAGSKAVWIVVLGALSVCCGASGPRSLALDLDQEPQELSLDRGEAHVHVGVMREVSGGRRRLDLSPLLDPKTVFEHLKASRQLEQASSSLLQIGVSGEVTTGLAATGQAVKSTMGQTGTTKATASSNSTSVDKLVDTAEGTTTEAGSSTTEGTGDEATSQGSSGSETTTTYARPAEAVAPSARLSPVAPSTSALSASYHSLLYATAETVLAGQGLESLFNVEALPEGDVLLTLPVIVSVQPGRVTRANYISDTVIDLTAFAPCGIDGLRVIAVAPLGLSTFAGDSNLAARVIQLSVGAGIPLGAALAQIKGGLTKEDIESLASVARRPEVQVSIAGSIVHLRYLGSAGLAQTVHLTPTALNVEIMLLARRGKFIGKQCSDSVNKHMEDISVDDRGEPARRTKPTAGPGTNATTGVATPTSQNPIREAPTGDDVKLRTEQITEEHKTESSFDLSSSQGRTGGVLLVGITSMFVPTEKLSGGVWSPLKYSTGRWELSPFHLYERPPVRVTSLAQGPGNDLIASVADGSDDGWRLCISVKRPQADGGVAEDRIEYAQGRKTPGVRPPASIRFPLQKPFDKDGIAYISLRPASAVDCGGDLDWVLFPVKVVQGPQPDPADKVIKVTSIQGTLESAAIVVRIEYEAPLENVDVKLNGAPADIRSLEPKLKEGKPVGGILYAAIAQTLSRRNDQERRVRVDVSSKGYPTVSTEIRAVW